VVYTDNMHYYTKHLDREDSDSSKLTTGSLIANNVGLGWGRSNNWRRKRLEQL